MRAVYGRNDRRDRHLIVIEDERTGSYSDGLCCILHADLDDYGAPGRSFYAKDPGKKRCQ